MGGRGATLEEMLKDLRAECGVSTNPAVSRSTRGRFITLLNRIQKRIYNEYEWPFLEVDRYIKLEAGSRYYDFPTDINMDRVIKISPNWGGEWRKVGFGIGDAQYSQYKSDGSNADRSDPVWRWKYYLEPGSNDPQIEVWPIPATDGDLTTLDNCLKITGTRALYPLVNDNDTCLLDSDMIVLYAAAEILAKRGAGDAQAKLENANKIYITLKGNATPATPFKVGGNTYENGADGRRQIELRVAYAGQIVDP